MSLLYDPTTGEVFKPAQTPAIIIRNPPKAPEPSPKDLALFAATAAIQATRRCNGRPVVYWPVQPAMEKKPS